MLRIGPSTTEVVFVGDDYRDVEPTYELVVAALDDGVDVRRWYDIDTYLGTMLRVMDGFVLVWVVVIFFALSFGLVNTLVMAVFERVREIGLIKERGATSINIDVRIEEDGDVRLSGHDIGEAPEQIFGKDDYEYWLTVPAAEKDRLLLALIEKIYKGNALVVSEMKVFLEERNIPFGFHTN